MKKIIIILSDELWNCGESFAGMTNSIDPTKYPNGFADVVEAEVRTSIAKVRQYTPLPSVSTALADIAAADAILDNPASSDVDIVAATRAKHLARRAIQAAEEMSITIKDVTS
jgi:hypothetical protein